MSERHRINTETDALILVDVQRDFCRGGALPVPEGDQVVPVLNQWLEVPGLLKIATRDWHPIEHCSFTRNGGTWPDHCVQHTEGAELHPDLNRQAVDMILDKGADAGKEEYSDFEGPGLLEVLRSRGIRRLWIGGLATEYCVKATVLDGRKLAFEVFVISDAIRGIEVNPGDCEAALREMAATGAVPVESATVLKDRD